MNFHILKESEKGRRWETKTVCKTLKHITLKGKESRRCHDTKTHLRNLLVRVFLLYGRRI